MGRANNWSLGNSSGTTNMGIWDEEPDVSSPALVKQSEIKSKWTPKDIDGIATHRYPLYIDNLNGENNVPLVQECIHFTAVKQGGISLQKVADNDRALAAFERKQDNIANKGDPNDLGENTGALGPTDSAGSFDAVSQTLNAKKSQTNTANEERTKKQKEDFSALQTGFTFIKGQHDLIRQPPKNLEHCFLYMPNSVQFSEGAAWGAQGLGATGDAVKSLIKSPGGDVGDIMKNFAGGVVTDVGKAVALAAGAAAGKLLAKSAILGAVGVASLFEGLGGGLRAAGRFTQNPYEEQLFNGIDFRTFTFDFLFAPSSEAEANEVDDIISMFRYYSRPGFVGGFLGDGLYSFPNEFNIEFLMNNNGAFEENEWLPAIYNCVCTNVSTNYTPEGFWVAHKDGAPVSFNLSLAFTETQKITQEDIEEGY